MENLKFTVVLVTYNRLECLKKTLSCYEAQTHCPETLIVINNASTDGTTEFLRKWIDEKSKFLKKVIHNSENIGGAGGFSKGVEVAADTNCDFIFLADDDAYAEPDMLEILNKTYSKIHENENVVSLCTAVVNCGKYDFIHRRRLSKSLLTIRKNFSTDDDYLKEYFEIDEFSFVGVALKKAIVIKAGLPRADYFIYFDDTEYSHRIGEYGRIICIPKSVMNHNVSSGHDDNMVTWRSYYSLRNSLDVLRRYYPRRYFMCEALRHYIKRTSFIASIVKKRTYAEKKLLRTAINDAKTAQLGKSAKYYPGCSLK